MSQLPDQLPLFPLPDHVLLPGLPVPFRIFEPRYVALAQYLLEQPVDQRWLAVPRLAEGWESNYSGAPAIVAVAAAAMARRIETNASGEFLMIVEGIQRCRLVEIVSTHSFRLARPDQLPPAQEDAGEVRDRMRNLLAQAAALGTQIDLSDTSSESFAETSAGSKMLDRLGALLLQDLRERQKFLEASGILPRISLISAAFSRLRSPPSRSSRWRPSTN